MSELCRRVLQTLRDHWDADPCPSFIFPSEVSSFGWAKEAARRGGFGSIVLDRFLSWDSFKEKVFHGHRTERPANSLVRSLFAEDFLSMNARLHSSGEGSGSRQGSGPTQGSGLPQGSGLKRFLPPEYAQDYRAFIPSLTGLLPGLSFLFSSSEDGALVAQTLRSRQEDAEYLDDLESIYTAYQEFLSSREYYEPNWLGIPHPQNRGFAGIIFFPELLDDWYEYEAAVKALPQLRTFSANADWEPRVPDFYIYDNTAAEFGAAFDKIEEILSTGLRPGEIVISLAGYDSHFPALEREAERRGIPIQGRKGKAISAFLPLRLFQGLRRLVAEDYDFDALEALFLEPGLPWKAELAGSFMDILQAGVEKGLAFSSREVWSWALTGRPREVFDLLSRTANLLSRAASFQSLGDLLQRVIKQLLEEDAVWVPADEGALQRAREVLRTLAETEAHLGLRVQDPFGFWLSRLEESVYVPRAADSRLDVYPYRVAAGLPAEAHFLLNLNQSDSDVMSSGLDFLREDQVRILNLRSYRKLSSDFYRVYAESGHNVFLSASKETLDGNRIPATWFIDSTDMIEARWPPPGQETLRKYSVYRKQAEGLGYYLAQGGPRARSSLMQWDPQLVEQGFARMARKDGKYQPVSNAQLELFQSCQLAFAVQYLLRPDAIGEAPSLLPPLLLGTAYHRVLELFFKECQEDTGALLQAGSFESRYKERIRQIAESELRSFFPDILLRYIQEEIIENCQALLAELLEKIPRSRIVESEGQEGLESLLDFGISGRKVLLYGKIDLVLEAGGGTLLIDFKLSNNSVKSAKSIRDAYLSTGGEDDPDLEAEASMPGQTENLMFQLPLYSLILSPEPAVEALFTGAKDMSPVRQMYYAACRSKGSKDKRVTLVYDREGLDASFKGLKGPEELALAQQAVLRAVRQVSKSVAEGRFVSPEGGCDACAFRGICREKFNLRMQEDV